MHSVKDLISESPILSVTEHIVDPVVVRSKEL
jgi:hypothetical protein